MNAKVVVNTSVIIAGLIGRGFSNKVLRLILMGKLKIVLSDDIFREYIKAVHYPKLRIPLSYAYIVLDRLYRLAEQVHLTKRFSICRDPDDNKFLEAAYEGRADYLITLDRDLLDLRNCNKELELNGYRVKILTPKELLELVESER